MAVQSERVRMEMRVDPDLPGISAVRIDADERLWCTVSETYGIFLVQRGRSESWSRLGSFATGPGTVLCHEPGSVHKDVRRDGPTRFQLLCIDSALIREHPDARGEAFRANVLDPRDPSRRALLALHRAYFEPPDLLTRQVVVAEAIDAVVGQLDGGRVPLPARSAGASLRRAVDYIHAHLSEPLSLDDVASAAGLDRYHLCRKFRQVYGLPPYAYALQARVSQACARLIAGQPVSTVASALGFCDQSQLHRHFRRALGVAPGAYARAARAGHPQADSAARL